MGSLSLERATPPAGRRSITAEYAWPVIRLPIVVCQHGRRSLDRIRVLILRRDHRPFGLLRLAVAVRHAVRRACAAVWGGVLTARRTVVAATRCLLQCRNGRLL